MDPEHGSGSSEHSSKHRRDRAGEDSVVSSRHSKTDSDEVEKMIQDIGIVQTELLPLVFESGESIKYTVTREDDDHDMIDLDHRTSSSSSSSSSISELEDFFQVTFPSDNKLPDHDDNVQLIVRKDDENDATSNGSSTIITSTTSQVSDLTHESLLLNLSPAPAAQSPPPMQVMEHRGHDHYDPERIPSSIFASKPSSPLEWSTASNESLFSIHVGNNSFSKDQFIMMGANLSGELTKSGELLLFSPTPPVKIVEVDRKSLDRPEPRPHSLEPPIITYESNNNDDLKESTPVYQNEAQMAPKRASLLSSSNSKQSEASGGSTHSFEFPILADGMESGLLKKEDSVRKIDEVPPPAAASKWTISCHCFSCFSWCHYPRCSCCC